MRAAKEILSNGGNDYHGEKYRPCAIAVPQYRWEKNPHEAAHGHDDPVLRN